MTWDRILDTFCQCDECLARGDRRGAMRGEDMTDSNVPITPAELQAMKEFCDSNPRHKYAFFAMDGGEIGPRVDVPRLIAEVERHQWRPISEAPKDGTRILVDDMVSRRCEIAYWDVDAGGWLTKDGDRSCGPTDFMPLPPPPIPPGDKT